MNVANFDDDSSSIDNIGEILWGGEDSSLHNIREILWNDEDSSSSDSIVFWSDEDSSSTDSGYETDQLHGIYFEYIEDYLNDIASIRDLDEHEYEIRIALANLIGDILQRIERL